jgi:tight adherence protein B
MGDGYLFIILLALTVATVGGVLVQVLFGLLEVKKRRLQERLGAAPESRFDARTDYGPIVKDDTTADLTGMLAKSQAVQIFHGKLAKAFPGVVWHRFLLMMAVFAGGAGMLALVGTRSIVAGVFAALMAGMLPFLIVSSKCAKHQRSIEDNLPEALDFLSRVLRAGHSLATGLQMAADEIPQPLAGEFRRCYDQHSLGATLETSMKEMAERVATPDFSFFVTAVLIQRTTGGDLAEVLTNIGNMVRARIRLQQHVKAVTAQGRMVGYTLVVLPLIFYCILYLLNPKYARVLIDTKQYPEGLVVLIGAVIWQLFGLVMIKKIVSVKM